MTIAALLMTGLLAFVLLVPTLMVAVLVSGLARRPQTGVAEPPDLSPVELAPVEAPAELQAS